MSQAGTRRARISARKTARGGEYRRGATTWRRSRPGRAGHGCHDPAAVAGFRIHGYRLQHYDRLRNLKASHMK